MSEQEPVKARRPKPVAGASNGPQPSMADVLAAVTSLSQKQEQFEQRVEERLARAESGASRLPTVPMQEPSKVLSREADPEELTPFVREIRAQTKPTPQDFVRHDKLYNWPAKLYAKPDGSVVSLQGDPQSRAYYRDKGFSELTEEQSRRWLGGEKQKVVEIQRQKAELINTLRELVLRDPNLRASISVQTEMAWDAMTVGELETFMADVMSLPDQNGKPRRKLRPPQRLIDAENRKAEAEADRLMSGVETNAPRERVQQFEQEQEQAAQTRRGRTVEINQRNAGSFA